MPLEPPWQQPLSYTGRVEISTRHGILRGSDLGIMDSDVGVFTSVTQLQGGTGIFQGASGVGYTNGTIKPGAAGFVGEMTGEVCLARPPWGS